MDRDHDRAGAAAPRPLPVDDLFEAAGWPALAEWLLGRGRG